MILIIFQLYFAISYHKNIRKIQIHKCNRMFLHLFSNDFNSWTHFLFFNIKKIIISFNQLKTNLNELNNYKKTKTQMYKLKKFIY